MKTISELSAAQLRRAAQIKEQVASLEKQLQSLLGQTASVAKRKGGLSAAGRAKISAALRARWAKTKAAKHSQTSGKPALATSRPASKASPQRKTMSTAQRAKIAATLKARWAKIKAAKASVSK